MLPIPDSRPTAGRGSSPEFSDADVVHGGRHRWRPPDVLEDPGAGFCGNADAAVSLEPDAEGKRLARPSATSRSTSWPWRVPPAHTADSYRRDIADDRRPGAIAAGTARLVIGLMVAAVCGYMAGLTRVVEARSRAGHLLVVVLAGSSDQDRMVRPSVMIPALVAYTVLTAGWPSAWRPVSNDTRRTSKSQLVGATHAAAGCTRSSACSSSVAAPILQLMVGARPTHWPPRKRAHVRALARHLGRLAELVAGR